MAYSGLLRLISMTLVLTGWWGSPAFSYTIATSIRPLYGIAAAVAGDAAEVSLLLDTPVSAHDATTRPSHIARIRQADAILIVDRDFERFLQRPLDKYAGKRPVIQASGIQGIEVLPRQIIDLNPKYDWRKAPKKVQDVIGDGPVNDYHLWLNPDYALLIAKRVRDLLVEKMPERQAEFDVNLMSFQQDVAAASARLKEELPGRQGGFLSAHDGYQYFTRMFLVSQLGTIGEESTQLSDPERKKYIRDMLAKPEAKCILQDAESKSREPSNLARASKKPLLTADPMGQNLPLDRHLYPQLLLQMGKTFADCLNS